MRPRFVFPIAALLIAILVQGCGGRPLTTMKQLGDSVRTPLLSSVSHDLLSRVLENAISEDGAVNVASLRSDTILTNYLVQLASVRTDIFASRHAQMAFWINAYNAYVLDMLRLNRITGSINDIKGMMSANVANIGGKRYSLSDIENTILAKQFEEPRMFFALSTGARAAPRFWREAYSDANLSQQLDRAVRTYIADSTKVKLDKAANTLFISDFFQRHRGAYERTAGNLTKFIRAFATPEIGEHIDQRPTMKIAYIRFDHSPHFAR